MMKHILTVAEEAVIRAILKRLLERNGYKVSEAKSLEDAKQRFKFDNIDIIISDLALIDGSGIQFLSTAANTPLIIMLEQTDLRSAVDCIKQGAEDCIAKPFEQDEMLSSVTKIIRKLASTATENDSPKPVKAGSQQIPGIIGKCCKIKELGKHIHKIASSNSTVLIHGETGTGKELVAKALHSESCRSHQPLISVNCAAIPNTLIESELFGYEKGAFTGANASRMGLIEAANHGTLFLDEIGELPIDAQARLLRFIQEGEIRRIGSVESCRVNVRLIAATHRDLKALSANGLFRQDLYYRINVIKLMLPPLRVRGNDILEIADAFLKRFCNVTGCTPKSFSQITTDMLMSYHWPGNIRELENIIERAVLLSENDILEDELMEIEHDNIDSFEISSPSNTTPCQASQEQANTQKTSEEDPTPAEDSNADEGLSLEDYFQRFVLEHQETMNETELAKKLGVSRKCLWERRQRLGIPRKKSSKPVSDHDSTISNISQYQPD